MPDFSYEDVCPGVVAGLDEAGRGPWAGPVVAAAVVLPRATLPADIARSLDDSKKLTRRKRETLFALLPSCAQIGVGSADVSEIDRLNILRATMLAMCRAVEALGLDLNTALVDGTCAPSLRCAVRCIPGGDGASLSIAAASIIAKVTRDRMMAELAKRYPGYGWERNAGYGTAEHRLGLQRLGVTPAHRTSFRPVAEILSSP